MQITPRTILAARCTRSGSRSVEFFEPNKFLLAARPSTSPFPQTNKLADRPLEAPLPERKDPAFFDSLSRLLAFDYEARAMTAEIAAKREAARAQLEVRF